MLPRKHWKWIFSKVPCKKSRLDARAKPNLARRRLRPNPGVDAHARQLEYRADVPDRPSQSSEFLSFIEGTEAPGRGHGSSILDSEDRFAASPALRLPACDGRASTTWDAGQPQTSG